MAVIIRGKTRCPLCQAVIAEGQAIVSFPAFIANENDELYLFNDAAFHRACFDRHSLADKAQSTYEAMSRSNGPGNRFCVICGEEIKVPDQYFSLGYLTNDESCSLYEHNYAQAHRECLPAWPDLPFVCEGLESLLRSGQWKGDALKPILSSLRAAKDTGDGTKLIRGD